MTGRRGTRSKNGCSTCRIRKVKCDEVRPLCARCRTSGMRCEWKLPATTTSRPKAVASRCPSSSRSSNALVLQKQRALLPRDMFGFSAGQQLANSLHLSAIDREYLAYFPQCSVVRWVGKPWEWGFLRHLYSNFAAQSSMVMRMILAVSASELENRRSTDPSLSVTTAVRGNPRAGVAHYSTALREFGGLLARCRDEKQLPTRSVIDEIVTAMFFMVTYEHLFCGEQTGLAAHLSGVHAFLSTCGVLDDPNAELGPNFSHVTKNILLFIMYIGIDFVALGGERKRDNWATAKDNTLFVNLLDNLYQDTRDTNSLVYQEEYPPEALLDDIAVFQPLEFIHECVKLRYLLLPLTSGTMAKNDQSDLSYLSKKLTHLGKRYNNLVRISAAEKPPRRLRELQTIYYSASEYHALQIMLHRLGCTNTDKKQPKCDKTCRVLKELVANLMAVLKRLRAIDPRTLARVCWPLAVAAEVVGDPAELLWVQQTVETSRLVSGSSTVFTFLET